MINRERACSYRSGSFAPIQQTLALAPYSYPRVIPVEIPGSEYVRIGRNLGIYDALGRDALMTMTCSVVSLLDGLAHPAQICQPVQLYPCLQYVQDLIRPPNTNLAEHFYPRPSYELVDYHHPKNTEDILTNCIATSATLAAGHYKHWCCKHFIVISRCANVGKL